jgi:hypothetical protein
MNYKAKWLAALSEKQTVPTQAAEANSRNVEQIQETSITATTQLRRLQSVMIEATRNAKSLAELMDECQSSAGIEFGLTSHSIDSKLGSMDLVIMARRLRDVIKLAEIRIGILTAATDNLAEANARLLHDTSTAGIQNSILQRATVETLLIGNKPTDAEFEDYRDNNSGTRYARYNESYTDVDESYVVAQLSPGTQLRSKVFTDDNDELESDSDDGENNHRQLVSHRRNRSAVIVPTNGHIAL